ncbi:MAG: SLC13 family permease, partial [Candidatus Omnitrophota bacterium]
MRNLVIKFVLLILVSAGLGFLSFSTGMNFHQSMSIAIFSVSILGTLFFWSFRLSFAFLGTSLLMITKTIDLEHLVRFASLEVILFLVGMMVIIGLLKDEGFFAWIVSLILRIRNLNAKKFVFSITIISA